MPLKLTVVMQKTAIIFTWQYFSFAKLELLQSFDNVKGKGDNSSKLVETFEY